MPLLSRVILRKVQTWSNVPKTKEENDTIFYIKANGSELGLVFQDA